MEEQELDDLSSTGAAGILITGNSGTNNPGLAGNLQLPGITAQNLSSSRRSSGVSKKSISFPANTNGGIETSSFLEIPSPSTGKIDILEKKMILFCKLFLFSYFLTLIKRNEMTTK